MRFGKYIVVGWAIGEISLWKLFRVGGRAEYIKGNGEVSIFFFGEKLNTLVEAFSDYFVVAGAEGAR